MTNSLSRKYPYLTRIKIVNCEELSDIEGKVCGYYGDHTVLIKHRVNDFYARGIYDRGVVIGYPESCIKIVGNRRIE